MPGSFGRRVGGASQPDLTAVAAGRKDLKKVAEHAGEGLANLRSRLVTQIRDNGKGLQEQTPGEQEVRLRVQRRNGDSRMHEHEKFARATGGPIEASVMALKEVTGFNFDIKDYMEHAVGIEESENGQGAGADVVATVVIRDSEGKRRRGFGIGKDSVFAKVSAIVNALNRLEWDKDAKGKSIPPQSKGA